MHKTILLFFTFFLFINCLNAKEWHGIVPLHSTKADVINILGKPTKDFNGVYYQLENEEVIISLQNGDCNSGIRPSNVNFNVPNGTVTNIGILLGKRLPLAQFKTDDANFKSENSNTSGLAYLVNYKEGFEIETFKGEVISLNYGPDNKEPEEKFCSREPKCCYDNIPMRWEGRSVKELKVYLDIVAGIYGDAIDISRLSFTVINKSSKKAYNTALLAKQYLVSKYKFKSNHIIISYGKDSGSGISKIMTRTVAEPFGDLFGGRLEYICAPEFTIIDK